MLQAPVRDEQEGYATSYSGLFENDLDAEVEDTEPGNILSQSFFSDFHGQDPHVYICYSSELPGYS